MSLPGWGTALAYLFKLVDRTWDVVDRADRREIQKQIDVLESMNQQAIDSGNVEEANATRGALEEIYRRLHDRNSF